MGKYWDEFKNRVFSKSVGVGMILFDLLILLVLVAAMILADIGRQYLTHHMGSGDLSTQVTLGVAEVLLDLTALTAIIGWLKEEFKRIFP